MNRFIPDTWLDALMRPFAMASPDAWVYIEVLAPDLRFALLILLTVGAVLFSCRKRIGNLATWTLTAFALVAFVPWLSTTGNGRYFIPILILSGVLCVSIVNSFPASKFFRLAIILIMICGQGFVISQNNPWKPGSSWGLVDWGDNPFFELELDREERSQAATYVTLSVISYSLVAPLFPPESSWINLSAFGGMNEDTADLQKVHRFLSSSKVLRLLVPSILSESNNKGEPNEQAVDAINRLLGQHLLKVSAQSCRLIKSPTLDIVERNSIAHNQTTTNVGFWVCNLDYPMLQKQGDNLPPSEAARIFDVLENLCPKFFYPGLTVVTPFAGGFMRHYQAADIKLYIRNDGTVFYKYLRALNPVILGDAEHLLSPDFKMDCSEIRSRSSRPWNRQI